MQVKFQSHCDYHEHRGGAGHHDRDESWHGDESELSAAFIFLIEQLPSDGRLADGVYV